MSKKPEEKKQAQDDKDRISDRLVQFIDDPKDSSILAKIHEMSNKAKRTGKSPTQTHHIRYLHIDDEEAPKQEDIKTKRRTSHFATVKNPGLIQFGKKSKEPEKNMPFTNKRNSVSNLYSLQGGNPKYKTIYVWDKTINRLVEKKVPLDKANQYSKETDVIKEDKKEEIFKFDEE